MHICSIIPAWFPGSTRPRPFEITGRQGSDLLTPGQKPAKLLKLLNPYLENRFCVVLLAGNKVIENMAEFEKGDKLSWERT